MVKSKNYDSPFDKEELDNLERQPLLDEEQLYNTGYYEEDEAYERYKEIEGLE